MNVLLRGVRIIDPLDGRDDAPSDVWIRDGVIAAVEPRIARDDIPLIELAPEPGREPVVCCPAFIDLHAHLREPGAEEAETVMTGARAAASGGFAHVVAMANTEPAIDTPSRVREALRRDVGEAARVHQVAAVTRDLNGTDLVDVEGCVEAGAVALSDDGRNSISEELLREALQRAGALSTRVLVHPEDERMIAALNPAADIPTAVQRPAEAEARAVETALAALRRAPRGRLHLQHLSTVAAVESLRRARAAGLDVTAEVTPHHLALHESDDHDSARQPIRKVNPPLRTSADVASLREALREGLIDAVATDHAPHHSTQKALSYQQSRPGIVGLELALATCLTLGRMGGSELPALVARLTMGPWRVLGARVAIPPPRVRVGTAATLVVFDPEAEWTVGDQIMQSRSRNTPLIGARLQGRVLLTMRDGRVVHRDSRRIPLEREAAAHA